MVHTGKESTEFMHGLYAHLGKRTARMLVGPGKGLDNGIVSIGDSRVMILTTDPVSAIPGLGVKASARLSVHLIASDYTSSGCDPEFGVFAFNFPEEMSREDRAEYGAEVGDECGRLGVAVAGGHTGSYPGAGFTVIGSGTMLGFAREDGYVTPAMANPGDAVLMTKHAAIEATASLALSFPSYIDGRVGAAEGKAARGMIRRCSTVEDARAARKVGLGRGGVSSMHDATEGGVLGALEEMAAASRKSFVIDPAKIRVPREVEDVCAAFKVDPLTTMGEGSLLITCAPERAEETAKKLSRGGIPAAKIGEVAGGAGLWLQPEGGPRTRFKPRPDPYWAAYDRAVARGLG